MEDLLTPREVDQILRYPRGRALKLARGGKLPAIILPDGEVRFRAEDIRATIDPARNGTAGNGGSPGE